MDEEHWIWSTVPFRALTLESGGELGVASAAGREGLNMALGGIGGGVGKD
jgi:hypothetical protein